MYSLSRQIPGMKSYYDTAQYQAQIQSTQQPVRYQPPPLPTRPAEPKITDYTVGWICAIEVEYIAACELLDREYGTPRDVPTQDDNHYTYGLMGLHNVVIACLPRGRYGLTSAASVAAHMLRTFPGLQVRFMVGIGGGAPSAQHDIRLGDVVVSTPVRRTGGVIHYEFGKTIQERKFERTGSLDSPPAFLLAAINGLSARHSRKGHQINQTIAATIGKNPRLRRLQRPDLATDILYKSNFIHMGPMQGCLGTCSLHDFNVVARPSRESYEDNPVVHYGLIASADRLMENAQVRDHLSATEGVICFEMEAAGLMDRFHCLVIRGICDYSDTHKNDLWQGYAASTAAAYAKELLGLVPQMASARVI